MFPKSPLYAYLMPQILPHIRWHILQFYRQDFLVRAVVQAIRSSDLMIRFCPTPGSSS